MSMQKFNGKQPPQQPKKEGIKIHKDDTTLHECACGSEVFAPGYNVGRLSQMHPKNKWGKPANVPFDVWYCVRCGQPMEEKTPKDS